jgi:ankyrin repeat protein
MKLYYCLNKFPIDSSTWILEETNKKPMYSGKGTALGFLEDLSLYLDQIPVGNKTHKIEILEICDQVVDGYKSSLCRRLINLIKSLYNFVFKQASLSIELKEIERIQKNIEQKLQQQLSSNPSQLNNSLHEAIKKGKVKQLRQLLKNPENRKLINQKNQFDQTPLDLAIRKDYKKIIKILLENHPIELEAKGIDHPLYKAIIQKKWKAAECLMKKEAYPNESLSELILKDQLNYQELIIASKDQDSIDWMLENINSNGRKFDRIDFKKLIKKNLLDIPTAEFLQLKGWNINSKDYSLDSCLDTAIQMENWNLAAWFVTNGADLEVGHPLHTAIEKGADPAFIRKLIKQNSTLLNKTSLSYPTPLDFALSQNNQKMVELILDYNPDLTKGRPLEALIASNHPKKLDMVKKLIELGADINETNSKFQSPLLKAIDKEEDKIITLLLNNKDIDCNKGNPLCLAISKNNLKLAELLKDKGADINAREIGYEKSNPLIIAIRRNNIEAVKWLIKNGADVNHEFNPLDWAIKLKHEEIIEILKQHRNSS